METSNMDSGASYLNDLSNHIGRDIFFSNIEGKHKAAEQAVSFLLRESALVGPLKSETAQYIAANLVGLDKCDELLKFLSDSASLIRDPWLWGKISILLQRNGQFGLAVDFLKSFKSGDGSSWLPLLDGRLKELEACLNESVDIPYFRSPSFNQLDASLIRIIDEPLARSHFSRVRGEFDVNGGSGAFRWPKTLKDVDVQRLQFSDATVLSDCSVLAGDYLLYELIKPIVAGWRDAGARCNEFFGHYSVSDHRVALTRIPNIVGNIDHGFLVPNTVSGIGHFIHDALPVVRQFHKYKATVSNPTIIIRALRPFDRQVILDLISVCFGDVSIIELSPGQGVRVKRLSAITSPFSPTRTALSRSEVTAIKQYIPSSTKQPARKIYIARADSVNVDNRSRVDRILVSSGVLERLGFDIITLSGLSFSEQYEIFRSATHIAGVHGAGMMNTLFGHDGLKVTEFVVPNAPNYFTIAMFAAALGYDYASVDCTELLSSANTDFSRQDVIAKVGDLLNR